MKVLIIIIPIGIVLQAVILISSIVSIIKAAINGIKLTAFGKGTGFAVLCTALAAAAVFFAPSFFSDYSDCKREIADYRERGSAVYTEKYDESAVRITITDEEKFVSQQIEVLEEKALESLGRGLMMIFWSITFLNYTLCNLIFVTKNGIVRITSREKESLFVDREENRLRINKELKNGSGSYIVCKLKDTPKNREILNPYIR